jgi:hypothetical protein
MFVLYCTAQIAVEVSRLTELKRAQRHQSEVSVPCHRQHHSDGYELARVKNVVFPMSPVDLPVAETYNQPTTSSLHKKQSRAKRLLPHRARSGGESCQPPLVMKRHSG